jgi:outer membrane protein OmpA-like peptidoglycan-associated protein
MILWAIQKGGEGVPIETDNIIPFSKLTLKDSAFPDGGTNFKGKERDELIKYITKTKRAEFSELGYDTEKDSYNYITVHGHGSLTGNFEQNMNIALKRAMSVAETIKAGYKKIGASNFPNKDPLKQDRYMISVCGHSYNFPKVPIDTNLGRKAKEDQQSSNRRVDVMYHIVPGQIMNELYLKD